MARRSSSRVAQCRRPCETSDLGPYYHLGIRPADPFSVTSAAMLNEPIPQQALRCDVLNPTLCLATVGHLRIAAHQKCKVAERLVDRLWTAPFCTLCP